MSLSIRISHLLVLFASCARLCHADGNLPDGYFDPSWAGEGRFTFQGDPLGPTYASVVTTLTVESNGNLLLGGQVIASSVNSWWIGELTASGTFVETFGLSNGSGRFGACLVFACVVTRAS
jgi:hypothetical protein